MRYILWGWGEQLPNRHRAYSRGHASFSVTAQVGRLNQVCGPACTENRRQIPSNSTTSPIREAYLGTREGYLGSYHFRESRKGKGSSHSREKCGPPCTPWMVISPDRASGWSITPNGTVLACGLGPRS